MHLKIMVLFWSTAVSLQCWSVAGKTSSQSYDHCDSQSQWSHHRRSIPPPGCTDPIKRTPGQGDKLLKKDLWLCFKKSDGCFQKGIHRITKSNQLKHLPNLLKMHIICVSPTLSIMSCRLSSLLLCSRPKYQLSHWSPSLFFYFFTPKIIQNLN